MDISASKLLVKYGEKTVLKHVSLEVRQGEIVTLVGPNGSGKSTLIKALCRTLPVDSGHVYLGGRPIRQISNQEVAKKLAVLPQIKDVANDVKVEALVSYGRFPHLGFAKSLRLEDKEIIRWAMDKTGVIPFKDRPVISLSGGERQRAWIAMALAQKTDVLVLDEPTTYLDISFQLEVLELIKELNDQLGISIIMVLHDLNQAIRYSDRIYVLQEGAIVAQGDPAEILDTDLLKDVFNIEANIYQDLANGCPYVIPSRISNPRPERLAPADRLDSGCL